MLVLRVFSSFSTEIDLFLRVPYVLALVTCSIKVSLVDDIVQKYEKKIKTVKMTEAIIFFYEKQKSTLKYFSDYNYILLTFCYAHTLNVIIFLFYYYVTSGLHQGYLQMFVINTIYPKIFGRGNDPITVLSKAIFDNFVSGPLLCLLLARGIKLLILNMPMRDSFKKMWFEIRHTGLLFKYWSVWIPMQCLKFSAIPEHLRILFIAIFALFWLIFYL